MSTKAEKDRILNVPPMPMTHDPLDRILEDLAKLQEDIDELELIFNPPVESEIWEHGVTYL